MEERKRIVKQIFNTFVFKIISFFVSIIRFLVIGRNFVASDSGAYSQILRIVNLGLYFFNLNLSEFMIRTVPGTPRERGLSIFKTVLCLEMLTAVSIISVIMLARLDAVLFNWANISDYLPVMRLCFLVIVIQMISMDFGRYFSAIKEIEYSNYISFFNSSFWLLLLLVLWGLHIKISLIIFFSMWIVGAIITISLGVKRIGIASLLKAHFDTSLIKQVYLFGSPLILYIIGSNLVDISSDFIISSYHGANITSVYFFSRTPLSMVYDFSAAIVISVFVPYILEANNQGNMEKKYYYYSIMMKYTLLTAIPLILGVVIGRFPLIDFFVRDKSNLMAGRVIPILAFSPIISIINYPAFYELYAAKKTFRMGIVYLLCSFLNVGLNLLLVPRFSYYGAAVSAVVSQLTILIVFYSITKDTLHLRWKFINLEKIMLAAFISGALAYFVFHTIFTSAPNIVRLLILGIIILGLYGGGLYFLKAFEPKEISLFQEYVRKISNNKYFRRIQPRISGE